MRGATWCVIDEVEEGDWGIGGKGLTAKDVHAMARGGRA
jgi:4-oxalocrotonate tautomerase